MGDSYGRPCIKCNVTLTEMICDSSLLMDLINKMPAQRLVKQKMTTVSDIVHSQLFLDPDCRAILLPAVLVRIRELLEAQDEVG